MNVKLQTILKLIMHVFSSKILISFQIGHMLNLLDVCFHVKIKIGEFRIYHHIFVINSSNYSFVLNQSFLISISINYDYRQNEIYVICINFDFIRSTVFKIMNKNDKQNMNQKFMYKFSTILKKKRFFLIDEKIAEQNNSTDSKIFFSNILNTRFVAPNDNKLTNMISEILNSKSEFNQFHTAITLYDKFKFKSIRLVFMFKNLSSAKKIEIKLMNLWNKWLKKKTNCVRLNQSQNQKSKRKCFCANF